MDINGCYNLLKYRATKQGYNATVSPTDFNLVFPQAEQRHFNKLYEDYLRTQELSSALTPFKSDPTTISIDGSGKYTKPAELLHLDALRHTYDGVQKEVQRFEDDRLANKLSSRFDAPSLEYPIYVEYGTFYQFYPTSLATGVIVYLKKLVPSFWNYTLVSGRPVYSSSGSVQPLWKQSDLDEIIYIALSDLGISMRDPMIDSFAERKIQTDL